MFEKLIKYYIKNLFFRCLFIVEGGVVQNCLYHLYLSDLKKKNLFAYPVFNQVIWTYTVGLFHFSSYLSIEPWVSFKKTAISISI